MQKQQWKGKTGGGHFGQMFLFAILRFVKVTAIYPVLIGIIPFYLIFAHKGYSAIYKYSRECLHKTKWQSFWNTCKTHYLFGEIVLDKFALLAGNNSQFKIEIDGKEYFDRLFDSPKGFIITSGHVGNLELLGNCLYQDKKKIYGIAFGGESQNYKRHRSKVLKQNNVELVPVTNDMLHLFTIKNALDNGDIIVLPCDRLFGSSKNIVRPFLGKDAAFPIGTFRVAAQMEVPMLTVFVMKEHGRHYRVYVRPIEIVETTSKIKQAELLAEGYIQALEQMVKRYPAQWFNFYNFWSK